LILPQFARFIRSHSFCEKPRGDWSLNQSRDQGSHQNRPINLKQIKLKQMKRAKMALRARAAESNFGAAQIEGDS
jgi:hypothetical protein